MAEAMTPTREYETIYVLKPELDDARIVEIEERLREVVKQAGGKSIKIHNWGKKKLSFEKDKVQKGIYVHHLYLGAPSLVAEYERVLKFLDDALLYQTIKLADSVDPETRPEEPDVLHLPVRDGGRRDRDHDDRHARSDDDDGDEPRPRAKSEDDEGHEARPAKAEAKVTEPVEAEAEEPEAEPVEAEAEEPEAEASADADDDEASAPAATPEEDER